MEAALQVGFITLFVVLGLVRPRAPGEGFAHADTLVNLVTGGLLFVLRVTAITWVAQHSQAHLVDLSPIESPLAQFAFVFLLTDFTRYWVHRAHHRFAILWTFHRVHHSSRRMNATSGLRMHVVDFLQLSAIPILYFGVVFDASTFHPGVWVALGAVVGAMDAFQHANLEVGPLRGPLKVWDKVFNNPHFHSWHHTRDIETHGDGNYGQALTVWDRLFGTCVSHDDACRELGLSDDQDLEAGVMGLQLLQRPKTAEP